MERIALLVALLAATWAWQAWTWRSTRRQIADLQARVEQLAARPSRMRMPLPQPAQTAPIPPLPAAVQAAPPQPVANAAALADAVEQAILRFEDRRWEQQIGRQLQANEPRLRDVLADLANEGVLPDHQVEEMVALFLDMQHDVWRLQYDVSTGAMEPDEYADENEVVLETYHERTRELLGAAAGDEVVHRVWYAQTE